MSVDHARFVVCSVGIYLLYVSCERVILRVLNITTCIRYSLIALECFILVWYYKGYNKRVIGFRVIGSNKVI